ncbi:MAG: hypothetical protein QXL89_04635 [Nitrososphaeria archaeon]
MEAQKHCYGITYDGEIVARGIELRRHDTPNLIKDFHNFEAAAYIIYLVQSERYIHF